MENMLHGHGKRSCLGGWRTLSPSAEPAALTVAVAKASWNAFERTTSDLVWRHRNPQVQPGFLGKPWSLTRMLSLGFTAHSWKENWVIFYPYGSIFDDDQPLLPSDRVDFENDISLSPWTTKHLGQSAGFSGQPWLPVAGSALCSRVEMKHVIQPESLLSSGIRQITAETEAAVWPEFFLTSSQCHVLFLHTNSPCHWILGVILTWSTEPCSTKVIWF